MRHLIPIGNLFSGLNGLQNQFFHEVRKQRATMISEHIQPHIVTFRLANTLSTLYSLLNVLAVIAFRDHFVKFQLGSGLLA